MAIKLSEIPIIEDIYDFDTISLREATEKVQVTLQQIEQLSHKEPQHLLWEKKAKRYLELALNEIDERKAVENFGNFCIEGQNDFDSMYTPQTSGNTSSSDTAASPKINAIQENKQPFGNVDDWIKVYQQLSQPQHSKKQSDPLSNYKPQSDVIQEEDDSDEEESKQNHTTSTQSIPKSSKGSGDISTNQRGQEQQDLCNNSMTSGKSFISSATSQAKYLSHQNKIHSKQKQNEMQEFIRQTLERTKITQTNGQNMNFYSTGTRTNFSSDDSVAPIKKKSLSSTGTQIDTKKKKSRQSLERPMVAPQPQVSSEYGEVQSRVRQELEEQRLKKLQEQNHYSLGKASYPKYKPPPEKKFDAEKEKQKRTKNFLKRSKPAVQLPPISPKPPLPKLKESINSDQKQTLPGIQDIQSQPPHSSSSEQNKRKPNPSEKLEPLDIRQEENEQSREDHETEMQNDEVIKELISEISQEGESDEDNNLQNKVKPGQPRKISKGELFRIKNGGSANKLQRYKTSEDLSNQDTKRDINSDGVIEEDIKQTEESQVISKQQVTKGKGQNNEEKQDNLHSNQIQGKKYSRSQSTSNVDEQSNNQKQYVHESESNDEEGEEEEVREKQERKDQNEQIISKARKQSTQNEYEDSNNYHKGDEVISKQSKEQKKQSNQIEQGKESNNRASKLEDQSEIEDNKTRQSISQISQQRISKQNSISQESDQPQPESKQTWVPKREEENPSDSDDDLNQFMQMEKEVTDQSTKNESLSQKNIEGQDEEFRPNNNSFDEHTNDHLESNGNKFNSTDKQSKSFMSIDRQGSREKDILSDAQPSNSQSTEELRQKMNKLIKGLDEIDSDKLVSQKENEEHSNSNKQSTDSSVNSKDIGKPPLKSKNEIFGKPSTSKANSSCSSISTSNQSQETLTTRGGSSQSDKKQRGVSKDGKKSIEKKKGQSEDNDETQNNPPNAEQEKQARETISNLAAAKKKANQAKPVSQACKLLTKMMKEINDDTLIDYSSQIPTFNHLFSGYYNAVWSATNPMMGGNVSPAPMNFCLIDSMRDIYSLFSQHVEKVDNADKGLLRYKTVVTPLDVLPSEVYYINDPSKVAVYQNRVNIDIRKFIERQIIFTQRMNGENFAGHLLPHEEFYYRVVKNKPEVYDIISRSFMRKREWFELPHGLQLKTSWNLLWTWSKPQIDFNKLLLFQKVNHFPFNKNLVRKDLLKKNFERITKLGPKAAQAFNILPLTFVLPKEYCNFSEKFYEEMLHEGEENNIWIMKPVGKSQGRGISLVNDISQVVYAEPVVVQKYMKDPLLLDGYKFDMRIYVLVTHMKPLEAFVYKEGFARLSTEKYQLNSQNIHNNQIHLTNYSIQKHHYDVNSGNNYIGGTKISLKMLAEKLEQKSISWEKIWNQVQEVIVKSLLACQTDIPNNPNCFEVFGYDIIIDQSLKCTLLEINSSPSLARDFIIDDLIKQQMVDDAIDLLSPIQFDRLRLLEVLDRRIREEQGNKSNINTTNNSKLQFNRDLNYILRGQKLRAFGETPANMGQWQQVAPSAISDKYMKIIQSYKLPSVRQNTGNAANNNNTID